MATKMTQRLVKSKQRVADHGEVFTPTHIVDSMLDLVKGESERIDSRFLEPACGEGAFLTAVLRRKLATVDQRYRTNEFERRHYALLGLMSIYGIELLEDNTRLCRENLVCIFADFIGSEKAEIWVRAARVIVELNIIQGDALAMKRPDGNEVVFAEWGYLGRGKFQRRDFEFGIVANRFFEGDSLFVSQAKDSDTNIFTPCGVFPPVTVRELVERWGCRNEAAAERP